MLSTRQKQKIVHILECELVELGKELTTRLPTLKALQEDYDSQRHSVEALQSQIEENKATISELIGAPATIRKAAHKQRVVFKWTDEVRKIVLERGQFMTVKECVDIILKKRPDLKTKSYPFLSTFEAISLKTKKPKLLPYNGKIGLSEWFLNNQPIASKLKEFLYAAS